jgi:hypothetical protein
MILSIFKHTAALIRLTADPPLSVSHARGVHT